MSFAVRSPLSASVHNAWGDAAEALARTHLCDLVCIPLLIAGERAYPPEHVGGPSWYLDFVRIIRDPADPGMLAWSGALLDPDVFYIVSTNLRLQRIKL